MSDEKKELKGVEISAKAVIPNYRETIKSFSATYADMVHVIKDSTGAMRIYFCEIEPFNANQIESYERDKEGVVQLDAEPVVCVRIPPNVVQPLIDLLERLKENEPAKQ